ncbi:MAG: D-hexose-6-phosphate mutarotase [Hyphomicrobiales bacterium]|nr:MAG: D-hexose-6-phosphate mutarotase [Hyphomicrobiales bacterium]
MKIHERPGLVTCGLPSGERLVASTYGGQVLSWTNRDGMELLYASELSTGEGGEPVRGGVPVCFPQFSGRGPLPQHGFARTSTWNALPDEAPGTIHFQLRDSESSAGIWPNKFRLDLYATLRPGELEVRLEVRNEGEHAWSFTGALHTYLAVSAARHTKLHGLRGAEAEDALAERFFTVREEVLDLSPPIDSVYYNVGGPLLLTDAEHILHIEQSGFSDVVVWNPGAERAPAYPDLSAADIPRLLVVEAAQARDRLDLAPHATWRGMQRLRLVQHCSLP